MNTGLKQEGLRVFAAWEPLAHRLRNGYPEAKFRIEDGYAWEHTEEFIRGLKERGFNLFITHFSKGHGMKAEAEEYAATRKIVELCHKHGIYAGAYVRYTTMIPDMLSLEAPDWKEQFAAVTANGRYSRYNTQYWRYIPCPCSRDYLDYFLRLIEVAVGDIGADCLHVDGLCPRGEPHACHCHRCRAAFQAWLTQRYPTPQSRRERFGYAWETELELPDYTVKGTIQLPLPLVSDPVGQEWMWFRCWRAGEIWKRIVESAHRSNPSCWMHANAGFAPYNNTLWSGSSFEELGKEGDGFFSEEGGVPDILPNGRVSGYFATFKKLRALDKTVLAYNRQGGPAWANHTDPEKLKRDMAHQMAFNRDSAGVWSDMPAPGTWPLTIPAYMAFHRDRRDLFYNAIQAHEVAVYYSERTLSINSGAPLVTINMARDVLLRGHVPFGYLFAGCPKALSSCRAVILPDVECIAAMECESLAAYVKAGGGLVILGPATGRYDEFHRLHRGNPLSAALGLAWSENGPAAFSARAGKGRVVYLRSLITAQGTADEIALANKMNYHLDLSRLSHPMNSADLLAQLRWVAGPWRFEITAPDTVMVEFTAQSNPSRYLLHLVNFDLTRDVGPFAVVCHGIKSPGVSVFTPDGEPPAFSTMPTKNGDTEIHLAGFHRYLVVVVGEKQGILR